MFTDIESEPHTPIYGQIFNLSSVLRTELGDEIPDKNITIQFLDDDTWENYSTQITDINGTMNFEIDTQSFQSEDEFKFRLTWQGDQYTLANSQNVTVSLYRAFNNISLQINSNVVQLFKNGQSTIQIILSNIGDSVLNVLTPNISIEILPYLTYDIVQLDHLALSQFKPGDTTEILIRIDISAIDQMNVSVLIIAKNEITEEEVTFESSRMFDIYDAHLEELLIGFVSVIVIGVFVIVWAAMFIYIRRTTKKIETPFEEPIKVKPRKGKYVSVSELPPEETEEKIEEEPKKKSKKKKLKKQKVEEKEKQKPSTDLDSLLEEKGLKDKD